MEAQCPTPTPLASSDGTDRGNIAIIGGEVEARSNGPLRSHICAVRRSASRTESRIKRVAQRALRCPWERVWTRAVERALVRVLRHVSERAERHALYRAGSGALCAAHNSAVPTRSAAPCTTRGHSPHHARSAVPHCRAIRRPLSRVSHSAPSRVQSGDLKGGHVREERRVKTGVTMGVADGAVSGGPRADDYALTNAFGHARRYAAYGALVARCRGPLAGRNVGRYQRVMCSAIPGAHKGGSISVNRA